MLVYYAASATKRNYFVLTAGHVVEGKDLSKLQVTLPPLGASRKKSIHLKWLDIRSTYSVFEQLTTSKNAAIQESARLYDVAAIILDKTPAAAAAAAVEMKPDAAFTRARPRYAGMSLKGLSWMKTELQEWAELATSTSVELLTSAGLARLRDEVPRGASGTGFFDSNGELVFVATAVTPPSTYKVEPFTILALQTYNGFTMPDRSLMSSCMRFLCCLLFFSPRQWVSILLAVRALPCSFLW